MLSLMRGYSKDILKYDHEKVLTFNISFLTTAHHLHFHVSPDYTTAMKEINKLLHKIILKILQWSFSQFNFRKFYNRNQSVQRCGQFKK